MRQKQAGVILVPVDRQGFSRQRRREHGRGGTGQDDRDNGPLGVAGLKSLDFLPHRLAGGRRGGGQQDQGGAIVQFLDGFMGQGASAGEAHAVEEHGGELALRRAGDDGGVDCVAFQACVQITRHRLIGVGVGEERPVFRSRRHAGGRLAPGNDGVQEAISVGAGFGFG